VHASWQHTPSTQKPVAHSPAQAHGCPGGLPVAVAPGHGSATTSADASRRIDGVPAAPAAAGAPPAAGVPAAPPAAGVPAAPPAGVPAAPPTDASPTSVIVPAVPDKPSFDKRHAGVSVNVQPIAIAATHDHNLG
jgi:hypothetical protein